jgi:hypothetical protein
VIVRDWDHDKVMPGLGCIFDKIIQITERGWSSDADRAVKEIFAHCKDVNDQLLNLQLRAPGTFYVHFVKRQSQNKSQLDIVAISKIHRCGVGFGWVPCIGKFPSPCRLVFIIDKWLL